MKTVNQMTVKEIIESIEVMRNGLSLNPGEREKQILEKNITRAQTELKKREDQKKSNEPSANQGQLLNQMYQPTTPKEKEEARFHKHMEEQAQNQQRCQAESAQAFEANRVVVGTITEAPIITVLVVEIALSGGAKKMNRVEIMNMLKTWFKRVATSKAMEKGLFSDAYGGAMGQDTYRLFQGWNTIYNETQEGAAWPPLEDVFPGLGRASQTQKVNAEILWRWASNDK